ncbi:MAG: DUF4926 domain-containing protein [Chloroflexi bacterium]|jgi:hypothetical protein|nr:DUF4926 domain-containing protein [Chloroflexota bacterium]MDL1883100.1 DUF4926 domain-containing protein [Anaerolineae bacterium CFX8]
MALELYQQVALTRNVPDAKLYQGDVAVLVDFVEHPADGEQGAILEVFNALGESIDVVTVPVSAIAPLAANQIPAVRTLAS